MTSEPIVTDEDRRQYQRWMQHAARWAESKAHRRQLVRAADVAKVMQRQCDRPYISWSAGKDSTVLVHFLCVVCGLDLPVMSLVTDLEPPNTISYMKRWADEWGIDLEIVRPDVSFKQWLRDHADEVDLAEKVATGTDAIGGIWDETLRQWQTSSPYDGCYWGIRNDESKGREANFSARGAVYQTGDLWRAAPLATWSGRDIYAYVAARDDIELMELYQCVRLHDHPKHVRKAMYLPDDKGGLTHQGATWLRTYYPSLYRELCEILPQTRSMA